MTQDEKWMARYEEVVDFIKTNHRNPSKHRIEEHDMLNWLKANRKALNAGKMKVDRGEKSESERDSEADLFFVNKKENKKETGFNKITLIKL